MSIHQRLQNEPSACALIEKIGNDDNSFEYVVASDVSCVALASARHANRALVDLDGGAHHVRFERGSHYLLPELQRSFPVAQVANAFRVATVADLAALLRRVASLSVHYSVRPRTITSKQWPKSFLNFWLALSVLRLNA